MISSARRTPALDAGWIVCRDTSFGITKLYFWVKDVLITVLRAMGTGFIIALFPCLA